MQPDTIVPSPANPQSWNRYSYVQNTPINTSDPTGHTMTQGDGGGDDSVDCDTYPQYCDEDPDDELSGDDGGSGGGSSGAGSIGVNNGCSDLGWSDETCKAWLDGLTNITIGADTLAAVISLGEAAIADIFIVAAIAATLLSGGSLGETLIIAAFADALIASVAGVVENNLGWTSLIATGFSDYLSGNTRVSNGNLYIGKDTIVSGRNTVLGFTPESNIDAIVSISQLKYDMDRLNGVKSGGPILISASNIDQVVGELLFYDSPLEDFINLVK